MGRIDDEAFTAVTGWNNVRTEQAPVAGILNDETLEEIRQFFKETKKSAQKGSKRPFKCPQCISRFTNDLHLQVHIKTNHDPNLNISDVKFACEQCPKVFLNIGKLKAHYLVHNDDRPFECKICGLRCKQRGALKAHYKLHAGLIFKCSICGKDFNNINNMKLHEQKHNLKEKKFACDLCGKSFKEKCLLNYHMRIHTGEKPYKCSVCSMAFALKSNMRQHFRTHTGEKPYKCNLCDKSFNQTSALTCHKRSHETFKPHKCLYCSKQFGKNEELISHLRLHGIRQKFKCQYCDIEFDQHNHLKSHMRLHTEMDNTILKRVAVVNQTIIEEIADENESKSVFTKILDKKLFQDQKSVGRPKTKRSKTPSSTKVKNTDKKLPSANKLKIKTKSNSKDSTFEKVFVADEDTMNNTEYFPFNDSDSYQCESLQIQNESSDDDIPLSKRKPIRKVAQKNVASLNKKEIDNICKPIEIQLNKLPNLTVKKVKSSKVSSTQTKKEKKQNTFTDDNKSIDMIKIEPEILIETYAADVKCEENTSNIDQLKEEDESEFFDELQKITIDDSNNCIKNEPVEEIKIENIPTLTSVKTVEEKSPKKQSSKKSKNNEKSAKTTRPKGTVNEINKCSKCSKKYSLKCNYFLHLLSHQKSFDCPNCELSHESNDTVRAHLKAKKCYHENAKYVCEICNKIFKLKLKYEYHMTIHSGEKPFQCDICKKCYRGKHELTVHMRKHLSIKPFSCEECGASFITKSHLKVHQLQHAPLDANITCKVCLKMFKSQGRLYNHMKIHQEDAYKCAHCGKGFKVLGNLKSHEVRHTGGDGTTYPCTVCGKSFQFSIKLKYHMRTHTGIRPYECTVCTSRFADISNLQKHMRIHTGEKPYKCNVCEKTFNQLSSLNSHKKSHLTYKPHKCTYCPKSFALDVDLIVHLRTHGEMQMFKCTMCDKEYEQLCHLKSHKRLHFGVLNEKINDTENDVNNIDNEQNVNVHDREFAIQGNNAVSYGNNYNVDIQGWNAIQREAEVKFE